MQARSPPRCAAGGLADGQVALGCRALERAISIACRKGIACGPAFGDGGLQIFEGQLAIIRIKLLGPLAIEGVAQFRDQVILTLGLGAQACHFGLQDEKRVARGRRKRIQIKGFCGGRGHAASYPITPQKPIFTR